MDINALIKEFKNHDLTNFYTFYNLTNRQVFFSAYSILKDQGLSEDIMQDTFVNFLNNIDSFKLGNNVYAYLSIIARNLAINFYNKQKNMEINDIYMVNEKADNQYINNDVDKILNLLDDDIEKEIVTYHTILEYKFKDIAKIINKPLGTVLWIYNKAIKKLKERIGEVL